MKFHTHMCSLLYWLRKAASLFIILGSNVHEFIIVALFFVYLHGWLYWMNIISFIFLLSYLFKGEDTSQTLLLLSMPGSQKKLRHVICFQLWQGEWGVSVCLLFPIFIHTPSKLSWESGQTGVILLQAWAIVLFCGKLSIYDDQCFLGWLIECLVFF